MSIFEEILPLGSNYWAVVADQYNQESPIRCRREQDIDNLIGKFDKLVFIIKSTDEPPCPESVDRAMHIARDILE